MASSAPAKYAFYLSGFGSFNGVNLNPTELLMKNIESYLEKHPLEEKDSIEIKSKTVYEVSAVGALQSFQELLLSSHLTSNPHQEHVFLLFGVNGKAGPEFALERTGWNDCSFRVPDERGWMPEQQPIVPRNGTIEQCFTSQLPLEKIQSKLTKSNFPVKISDDPGRFLCNFIFYHSMNTAQQLSASIKMRSVFIHVPPFDKIPEEEHLKFARALIDSIVKCDRS